MEKKSSAGGRIMGATAVGRREVLLAGLLVAWGTLLAAGKQTIASADEGKPSSIHVCVKEGGKVRIVAPSATCRSTEKMEHWSITVAQGPPFPTTCPPDSVLTGTACLDKYEASLWRTTSPVVIQRIKEGTVTKANLTLAAATQLGLASGDLAAAGCPASGTGCAGIFALSIPGVKPARFLTWFQAVATARNAGKRLPTNVEWQAAALGTPDPGASPEAGDCNTKGDAPDLTGARANCVSGVGAFDMVGNVSEWVADWAPRSRVCGSELFSGTGDMNCLAGGDSSPGAGALVRGGGFSSGAGAGIFAVDGRNPPSFEDGALGFRAAR